MRTLLRAGIAVACCVTVAGCAVPVAPPTVPPAMSAHDARDAVAIGKSTKADVIATLGKTVVISFENGFEVWVYHFQDESVAPPDARERIGRARPEQGSLAMSELVVLFAPSGIVTKTRIRTPPPPVEAKRG